MEELRGRASWPLGHASSSLELTVPGQSVTLTGANSHFSTTAWFSPSCKVSKEVSPLEYVATAWVSAERKEFKGPRGALASWRIGSPACSAPGLVDCLAVEPALEQLQAPQEISSCQENGVSWASSLRLHLKRDWYLSWTVETKGPILKPNS